MNSFDEDEVPKKIGAFLLQGYTLLDVYCPDCMNPMMRARGGVNSCVVCPPTMNELQKSDDENNSGEHNSNESTSFDRLNYTVPGGSTSLTGSCSVQNVFGSSESLDSLKTILRGKLIWASLRLSLGATEGLSLMKQCARLLVTLEDDLSSIPEYHASIVNLRRFIESLSKSLKFSNDLRDSHKTSLHLSQAVELLFFLHSSNKSDK
ncbi:uncharacterized protein LOC141850399 [Brevipalpus obovatus]|uniref:uncharacterized protein LOC141850399 n=1 Tax=Brevipalpus obovatus TaxID=246614 RepID=UPI003D9F268D